MPRAIEFTNKLLVDNIASPLGADIYVHSWSVDSADKHNIKMPFDTAVQQVEFLYDVYNAKNVLVEECLSPAPMFESISKSIKMAGGNYDIVVRARMDSFFDYCLPHEEIRECLDSKSRLFVRFQGVDYGHYEVRSKKFIDEYGRPFVCDNFAFGGLEVMKLYGDTLNSLELSKRLFSENAPPEVHLGFNLTRNGVEPKMSSMEFDCFHSIDGGVVYSYNYYEEAKIKRRFRGEVNIA